MRGMGQMVLSSSTLVLAMACQTCASFGDAYAQAQIETQANVAAASFAAETALPGQFGSGALSPVRVDADGTVYRTSTSNSFADPLYGAPAPLTFSSAPPELTAGFKAIGSTVSQRANLEWSGSESVSSYKADRKAARIAQPLELERDFSAEFAFDAPKEQTGLDFDVGFTPRLAVTQEGAFSTRRLGAEVRLGQSIDARGQEPAKGWYMFAGADGEALVWEAGDRGLASISGLTGGAMKLRDQITVGDVQAGFAVHRGGGQLSLSYIRREVEYKDRNGGFSENENFAGVSFTLKR